MSSRQLEAVTAKSLAAASDALPIGGYLLFAEQPGLRLFAGKRARTWTHRYRQRDGSIVQLKLGRFPAISYAEAVAAWEENNRRRERNDDPAVERERSREQRVRDEAAQRAKAYTVERMIEDYLAEHVVPNRTAKSAREVERIFDKHLVQRFGSRSATDISRRDAAEFLHTLAPSIGRTTRNEARAAFEHALSRGRIDEHAANPWLAVKGDRALNKRLKAQRRSRYLTDAECSTLLRWLPTAKLSRTSREALHLTLMLGMRSGEVVAGRWRDIDLDAGVWSLPKTKTDAPRVVRLPRQAVAILRSRVGLSGEFVFPNQRGDKSVGQNTLVWSLVRVRESSGLADWSAHDLRRTCRTGLSRIGCPHDVGEAALGHTVGGVAGVYQLHKFESEVGAWLQKWADHLDALVSPSVVPLVRREA